MSRIPQCLALTSGALVLSCGVFACGGQVDEPAPTTIVPAQNAPANVPNAAACAGACARMEQCGGKHDETCARTCGHELPRPAQAAAYGACIQALSCETIVRGLSMNDGPLGACWRQGLRAEP